MMRIAMIAAIGLVCVQGCKRSTDKPSPPEKQVELSAAKEVDAADLVQLDGNKYEKGHEDVPFTGIVTRTYEDGRKTRTEFKNGKGNGLSTLWHATGEKAMQVTLVDDEPHGVLIKWDEKGHELSRTTYTDGKEVGASKENVQPEN